MRGWLSGYDAELEDEVEDKAEDKAEDKVDSDPSNAIQGLTDLEVFTQTLQNVHDASTAAEHECQKGNKRPRRYLGNSKRTWWHHLLNQKELKKKVFTSVMYWILVAQNKKRVGSVTTKCSSGQAEPDYVSSDKDWDHNVRGLLKVNQKGALTVDVLTGQYSGCGKRNTEWGF